MQNDSAEVSAKAHWPHFTGLKLGIGWQVPSDHSLQKAPAVSPSVLKQDRQLSDNSLAGLVDGTADAMAAVC